VILAFNLAIIKFLFVREIPQFYFLISFHPEIKISGWKHLDSRPELSPETPLLSPIGSADLL
jgi:hypothetical protein